MLKFRVIRPSSSPSSPSPSSSSHSQRFSHPSTSSSSSSSVFTFESSGVINEQQEGNRCKQPDVPSPPMSVRLHRRRAPSPSPSLPLPPSYSTFSNLKRGQCPPPIPPKKGSNPPTRAKAKREENEGGQWGNLRVYTAQLKPDTDYKTLRVSAEDTTETVVAQLVLDKLRLSLRDPNLFHLFMEVRSRKADGTEARNILELNRSAHPLKLQKCHPEGKSRFILGMDSNAILVRIFDGEVCPESNYKSVLISRMTSCAEVLQMLHRMCRMDERDDNGYIRHPRRRHNSSRYGHLGLDAISELRLFVVGPLGTEAILGDCPLAGVFLALMPGQRIVLRRVIVPTSEALL